MRLLVVVAVAGCSFDPRAPTTDDDADRDAAVSANDCRTPNPTGLVVCYQFDNDLATLVDDSGNRFDAPASGFSPMTRSVVGVTSQAALVGANAAAVVPQDPRLELLGDYTITAWLLPIDPTAGNEGIIDHNGQWAFSIENQLLTCWFSRSELIKRTLPIATGWQFAACTASGTVGCTVQIGQTGPATTNCMPDLSGATPAGNSGFSIGSFENDGGATMDQFAGAIDDVRVYARALSGEELCVLAGRPGCT